MADSGKHFQLATLDHAVQMCRDRQVDSLIMICSSDGDLRSLDLRQIRVTPCWQRSLQRSNLGCKIGKICFRLQRCVLARATGNKGVINGFIRECSVRVFIRLKPCENKSFTDRLRDRWVQETSKCRSSAITPAHPYCGSDTQLLEQIEGIRGKLIESEDVRSEVCGSAVATTVDGNDVVSFRKLGDYISEVG